MAKQVERLIGKRIAALRKEKGFTQAQLAESIDVVLETISRLERGVSIPSISTLEDMAEALGIPLKDIFDFHIATKKQSPAEKEIARVVALLKNRKADEIKLAHTLLQDLFRGIRNLK